MTIEGCRAYVPQRGRQQHFCAWLAETPRLDSTYAIGLQCTYDDASQARRRSIYRSAAIAGNYAQIAKNFLYEIKKMEEEVHEYLQRLPEPEHTIVA